jgi:hypothetical protein
MAVQLEKVYNFKKFRPCFKVQLTNKDSDDGKHIIALCGANKLKFLRTFPFLLLSINRSASYNVPFLRFIPSLYKTTEENAFNCA